ncbi:ACT domain-containing protein [Fusibacter paucivorans]|uniref:ACT domain-containing protein n=1 Tax=Fusibacter paucivorans TaxID=76009 RepID=A0ABS5PLK3_9FIRM|nr:ACT domain-containing protein [Fusibacter paucivorans]MBS7526040.1 ACT domain-containing protein [Fusibacter paucivorans]
MQAMSLKLKLMSEPLSVCRLDTNSELPVWALKDPFFSITKTADELSVVCSQSSVPEGILCETDWCSLKVMGPLDFSLIGILSKISDVLAKASISIFAVSTYDTDYIMLKATNLEAAVAALSHDGILVEV